MEKNRPTSVASPTIGFLGYGMFENDEAFRGAILTTDEWSKPLEFRCTAPVRPTSLQRTLYGQSLLPHILTELIGAPLISTLRETPSIILIQQEAYFDVRHKISLPVIRVLRASDPASKQDGKSKSKSLLIQSASGKFAQVQVEAHWKFADDLEAQSDLLRDLLGRWDLTEPFQRLTEGLQYVHDEHVLES